MVFALLCLALAGALGSFALEYLSPSLFHSARPASVPQGANPVNIALAPVQMTPMPEPEARPVYAYSVVDGGVRDAHELKLAVQRDPVVAAHYAGFNFARAQLIRLAMTRTVFVSYRMGNRVYWTRKRVRLQKGETLITDGNMTARTRCANRVEETPQQANSQSEPAAAKFEEPVHPAVGTAQATPPAPFESSLLTRPPLPGLGPAPPLSFYDPLSGGGYTPVAPPPLPSVCGVGIKKKNEPGGGTTVTTTTTTTGRGKKGTLDVCSGGVGGEVPEPGTLLLVGSGLAGIYWKRRKSARS